MSAAEPNLLLPRQTSIPLVVRPQPRLRRRQPASPLVAPSAPTTKQARQVLADQSQVGPCLRSLFSSSSSLIPHPTASAETQCQFLSGNNIISCYPTNDTVVPQHEWTTFVCTCLHVFSSLSSILPSPGNARLPQYQYTQLVDIYLFRADSQRQVLYKPNVTNTFGQAGTFNAQVNDSWWGSDGVKWNGSNISYPFYWIISPNTLPLDGSQIPQSIFSAVRECPSCVTRLAVDSPQKQRMRTRSSRPFRPRRQQQQQRLPHPLRPSHVHRHLLLRYPL